MSIIKNSMVPFNTVYITITLLSIANNMLQMIFYPDRISRGLVKSFFSNAEIYTSRCIFFLFVNLPLFLFLFLGVFSDKTITLQYISVLLIIICGTVSLSFLLYEIGIKECFIIAFIFNLSPLLSIDSVSRVLSSTAIILSTIILYNKGGGRKEYVYSWWVNKKIFIANTYHVTINNSVSLLLSILSIMFVYILLTCAINEIPNRADHILYIFSSVIPFLISFLFSKLKGVNEEYRLFFINFISDFKLLELSFLVCLMLYLSLYISFSLLIIGIVDFYVLFISIVLFLFQCLISLRKGFSMKLIQITLTVVYIYLLVNTNA